LNGTGARHLRLGAWPLEFFYGHLRIASKFDQVTGTFFPKAGIDPWQLCGIAKPGKL
jgi:hypothetical protein